MASSSSKASIGTLRLLLFATGGVAHAAHLGGGNGTETSSASRVPLRRKLKLRSPSPVKAESHESRRQQGNAMSSVSMLKDLIAMSASPTSVLVRPTSM